MSMYIAHRRRKTSNALDTLVWMCLHYILCTSAGSTYWKYHDISPISILSVLHRHLMVWKCVHSVAPAYLSDFCVPATAISGHRHLQSAATGTLLVSCARTTTEQQSFTVNGPATWNRLPPALRSPDLLESAFKKTLKTHLFLTAPAPPKRSHDYGARYKYRDLLNYVL